MEIINSIVTWVMKKRIHDIDLYRKYPHEVQQELFQNLITKAKGTEWGKKYGYSDKLSVREFQERVPISTYEELYPYIERVMMGEQNILWPTKTEWFAKSSGTTNARSKYIPVSPESLEDCHYKGGKDMLSIYVNLFPETKLFTGKGLSIGGSHRPSEINAKVNCGDVSAVIM